MSYIGMLGIFLLIAIAFLFSNNRKAINVRTVVWGFLLQLLFSFSILATPLFSFIATTICVMIITVYIMIYKFWLHRADHPVLNKLGLSKTALVILGILKVGVLIYIAYVVSLKSYAANEKSIIDLIVKIFLYGMIANWLLIRSGKIPTLVHFKFGASMFLGVIALSLGAAIAMSQVSNGLYGTVSCNMTLLSNGIAEFIRTTSRSGAEMVFGPLVYIQAPWYFLFFVQVLPTIVFFSALISVLYYLGIIQIFVEELAQFMKWTMQTSGAETLSCAANIFVGQTEAPILIKPYIAKMTNSELHAVMTGGFATIAGGVFAGFVAMGIDANYLMSACLMSAPGSMMLSKIFYPESEKSQTNDITSILKTSCEGDTIVAVASRGTAEGLQLALNVGAMLLSFIALMKAIDMGISLINNAWSLNYLFGKLFYYVAFLLGVTPKDAESVGMLLGNKIAINEFIAYEHLSKMIAENTLTEKSKAIATYALCGFANFSSIGIQIGGISPMAPNRHADIAKLGVSAMWAGTMSSWITAAIAGLFIR